MTAETTPDPNPKGLALEVLVDTHEPVIYMLNKSEAYIGSLDTNEIVVNQKEISRKHLKIFFVDGNCYVNDQGSTNGTYVNDTKIIPGKRVEFLPFMSIRLGSKVLLTLISRERPDVAPDMSQRETFMEQSRIKRSKDDKTRIISLKELHEAKTQKIQKKRKEVVSKRMKESKRMREEKAALKHIAMIAGMWLAIGVALNIVWMNLPQKAKRLFGVREKRLLVSHTIDDVENNGYKIPETQLLSRISLSTFLGTAKCQQPREKALCNGSDVLNESRNGAIINGQSVMLLIDFNSFVKDMEDRIAVKIGDDSLNVARQDVVEAAVIHFIGYELAPLVAQDAPHTNYYIVLYNYNDEKYRIQSVVAIRNSTFKTFMADYQKKPIEEHFGALSNFVKVMSEYYQEY